MHLMQPFFLLVLLLTRGGNGENILFFWAVSGTSHRISVWPLVEALVEKGHNVTFFSPLPPKQPNPKVHDIVVEELMEESGLAVDFLAERLKGPDALLRLWGEYFDFAILSCQAILARPALVEWINNSNYDLVVINAMFNDCAFGLAYKFKAPHILYGTTAPFGWFSETYGYFDENFPEFTFHYPEDMTFLQSVRNALQPLWWEWNRKNYMFPKVEELLRKGLGLLDLPPLEEIERNVSLVFLNTNAVEEYPRSLPPLFVPIGGMHCSGDTKPLDKELEDFISKSNVGFVYFSFGTFANPASLPQKTKDAIFHAMGNMTSVQFLVKWIDDSMGNVATNVKLVKWVSQQDVLAHPKIRAFISHGGLLGTQEALFHGVPLIVIPLFAEQDYNGNRVHSRGRGLMLSIDNLTREILQNAVSDVLRNNTYRETTKKLSKLFRERQARPVDTAVWWVEYVLRHRGASDHLRPIGISKTWWQRRLLDIWGFILLCFLALVFIFLGIMKLLLGLLLRGSSKKSKND